MVRLRALHVVARLALRVLPPRRAKEVVYEAARVLPLFSSEDEARVAASALDGHGTCLSRALCVAARLPGASVVIGVGPGGERTMVQAHAWVEMRGVPLRESDPRGEEIARL